MLRAKNRAARNAQPNTPYAFPMALTDGYGDILPTMPYLIDTRTKQLFDTHTTIVAASARRCSICAITRRPVTTNTRRSLYKVTIELPYLKGAWLLMQLNYVHVCYTKMLKYFAKSFTTSRSSCINSNFSQQLSVLSKCIYSYYFPTYVLSGCFCISGSHDFVMMLEIGHVSR